MWSFLRTRSRRIILMTASALAGWLVVSPAGATQTVYERMAKADVVLWVQTVEGTLRLAECRVLEVLKGHHEGERIFVAFRGDNMNRERWRDRIVFEAGEQSVLLLRPALDTDLEVKAPDRFRLVSGFEGKIDLPL